jgi:hypothetical protein
MPGCVAIDGKGAFCRWSAISNLVLGDAGARRLVLVVRSQNRFHCRWPTTLFWAAVNREQTSWRTSRAGCSHPERW